VQEITASTNTLYFMLRTPTPYYELYSAFVPPGIYTLEALATATAGGAAHGHWHGDGHLAGGEQDLRLQLQRAAGRLRAKVVDSRTPPTWTRP
jgi:hypothetical protein